MKTERKAMASRLSGGFKTREFHRQTTSDAMTVLRLWHMLTLTLSWTDGN
jgi:hypothetical protein